MMIGDLILENLNEQEFNTIYEKTIKEKRRRALRKGRNDALSKISNNLKEVYDLMKKYNIDVVISSVKDNEEISIDPSKPYNIYF